MDDKLTPKQQRFVDEYLIDLNATQAAIRAGYSKKTANEQGARLLVNVSIQKAISERQAERSERTEIDQDYVLIKIKEMVEKCMGNTEIVDTVIMKNPQAETIHKELVSLKRFDPIGLGKALDMLAKHVGFYEKDNKKDIEIDISTNLDILSEIAMKSIEQSKKLKEKISHREQTETES